MFITFKNMIGGKLSEMDNNKLFIVNRWASFLEENADACSKVDRLMLKCDKEILKGIMALSIKKRIPKYLKAEEVADKFLVEAYKKHYGFSQREYDMQKHLIKVDMKTLALEQGWSKKECKKYTVDWFEPKKQKLKKVVKRTSFSLEDF